MAVKCAESKSEVPRSDSSTIAPPRDEVDYMSSEWQSENETSSVGELEQSKDNKADDDREIFEIKKNEENNNSKPWRLYFAPAFTRAVFDSAAYHCWILLAPAILLQLLTVFVRPEIFPSVYLSIFSGCLCQLIWVKTLSFGTPNQPEQSYVVFRLDRNRPEKNVLLAWASGCIVGTYLLQSVFSSFLPDDHLQMFNVVLPSLSVAYQVPTTPPSAAKRLVSMMERTYLFLASTYPDWYTPSWHIDESLGAIRNTDVLSKCTGIFCTQFLASLFHYYGIGLFTCYRDVVPFLYEFRLIASSFLGHLGSRSFASGKLSMNSNVALLGALYARNPFTYLVYGGADVCAAILAVELVKAAEKPKVSVTDKQNKASQQEDKGEVTDDDFGGVKNKMSPSRLISNPLMPEVSSLELRDFIKTDEVEYRFPD